MPEARAPALRHRQRVDQGREQAEVAELQAHIAQAGLAQRRDNEHQHSGVVTHAVGGGERFDAGLPELARVRAVGVGRLIAEGRAGVAVAGRRTGRGVPLQMQPAAGHGEVRAQAQLGAVGIDEHVGARAQALADHVEEQLRRLDHRRRDALVAGTRERRHEALRQRVQSLDVGGCGGGGHGTALPGAPRGSPLPACGDRARVRGGGRRLG